MPTETSYNVSQIGNLNDDLTLHVDDLVGIFDQHRAIADGRGMDYVPTEEEYLVWYQISFNT